MMPCCWSACAPLEWPCALLAWLLAWLLAGVVGDENCMYVHMYTHDEEEATVRAPYPLAQYSTLYDMTFIASVDHD
jgi:hypothetical protein